MKLLFILFFILIIISLGIAFYHLVRHKDPDHSKKTVKALTYRVRFSLILFFIVFIAYATGMIKPTGIGARINMQKQKQIENENAANIAPL